MPAKLEMIAVAAAVATIAAWVKSLRIKEATIDDEGIITVTLRDGAQYCPWEDREIRAAECEVNACLRSPS